MGIQLEALIGVSNIASLARRNQRRKQLTFVILVIRLPDTAIVKQGSIARFSTELASTFLPIPSVGDESYHRT